MNVLRKITVLDTDHNDVSALKCFVKGSPPGFYELCVSFVLYLQAIPKPGESTVTTLNGYQTRYQTDNSDISLVNMC